MDSQQKQEKIKRNPWKWRRGHNPYKFNAFTTVRASPGLVNPRQIATKVDTMKRLVKRAPGQATVHGCQVTEGDVANAAQVLTSPNERMVEELLCHRPHPIKTERFKEHIEYFGQLHTLQPEQTTFPEIANLDALRGIIPKPEPRTNRTEPVMILTILERKLEEIIRDEIVFDL